MQRVLKMQQMSGAMSALQEFGAALIILGLVLDLLTLILKVSSTRRGRGSSGVPLIPVLLYYVGGVMLRRAIITSLGLLDLGVLTLFHVLSQYAVPWAVSRFWCHRRS